MKKFKVTVTFRVTGWKEVEAENEEDAEAKAHELAGYGSPSFYMDDEEVDSVEVEALS